MGLLLVVSISVTAIGQSLGLVSIDFSLALLDERLPGLFRVHMGASGLALLFIVIAAFLRRAPRWHRIAGRLALILVLIGGLAALPSAVLSEALFAARAGFFAQGLAWLALAMAGFVAIRRKERARHARLMLLMAAVGMGAIVLRLSNAAVVVWDLPFEVSYAVIAWTSWLLPLALVWAATRKRTAAIHAN